MHSPTGCRGQRCSDGWLTSLCACQAGGFEFSHGVAFEGDMQLNKVTGIFRWQHAYLVVSRTLASVFYWVGTAFEVVSQFTRVPFKDITSVRQRLDSKVRPTAPCHAMQINAAQQNTMPQAASPQHEPCLTWSPCVVPQGGKRFDLVVGSSTTKLLASSHSESARVVRVTKSPTPFSVFYVSLFDVLSALRWDCLSWATGGCDNLRCWDRHEN